MIETLLSDSPDPGPLGVDDSDIPASKKPDPPAPPRTGLGGFSPRLLALGVVIIVLGWAYAPNLRSLYATWDQDPNYSHGFLVIPVALVIAWRRWVENGPPAIAPAWWGWVALGGVLVARALCYERGFEWTETATLLPTIACLTLAAGGWPLLRRVWPAIGFLIFLLPLPRSVNSILAQPLQHVATVGSCVLLRLTGLWVVAEGNVILVGGEPLEVAAACNGLSMLMTLAATVAAMTALVPMAAWQRIVLFLSIIPIALISNILRITSTAWCYHLLGSKVGEHYAHDAAGWLMMPVALVLVGLELGLLSWLVVREEVSSGPTDVLLRRRTT